MPKHWWLLVGDNPDKTKHEENLRIVIEQAGGEVLFFGFDPSKRNPDKPNAASKDWYALVDTEKVRRPDDLGKALRARGAAKVLLSVDEPDDWPEAS